MDVNIIIYVSMILYMFLITLRYWKTMYIFNIMAIAPLIILITQFGFEVYPLTAFCIVLIIFHIVDFIMILFE